MTDTSSAREETVPPRRRRLIPIDLADPLERHVALSAGGTLALRVGYTGLAFLTTLVLARSLGSAGFGYYAYAQSWVLLLILPATLGFDKLLVREVAGYMAGGDWGLMRGLLRRANTFGILLSVLLAALAGLIAWGTIEPRQRYIIWIALAGVPLLALMRLRQSTIQALRRIVVAHVPEMFLEPALFLILVVAMRLARSSGLTPEIVTAFKVVTTAVAFLLAAFLLRRAMPAEVGAAASRFDTRRWLRSSMSMAFTGAMYVLNGNIDVVLLGAIRGPEAVGLYSVANRAAGLVLLALLVVNKAAGPEFARLSTLGEKAAFQKLVTRSARGILLLSAPVAAALILGGPWLLPLFGSAFSAAHPALVILTLAQLVNAACGSVGLILMMTGHERLAAINVGASAVANVLLNLALIPRWGVEGAAVATGLSIVLVNVLQCIAVARCLGIVPAFIGVRKASR